MRYLWIEDMHRNKIYKGDFIECILEDGIKISVIALHLSELLKFIQNTNLWDFKVVWNIYRNSKLRMANFIL